MNNVSVDPDRPKHFRTFNSFYHGRIGGGAVPFQTQRGFNETFKYEFLFAFAGRSSRTEREQDSSFRIRVKDIISVAS